MPTTTNRDIDRLRRIVASGGRKCDAVDEMGRTPTFVNYWTKTLGLQWAPKRKRLDIRPAIADLAMARLCNTMAALRG